jgi:aryl-alcohol dehydrogenase-like predicted oxidoreductase
MTFGGKDTMWAPMGALPLADVDRIVGSALDAGVNHIDTANVYSNGESEEMLGRVLKGRRRDVFLGTKVHARMGPGPNDVGTSRLHVMQALDDSLRRLQTDHIDLYQIHNFDHVTPLEETLRALDDAVRQGKIRYISCANFTAWQISKALGISALRDLSGFVSVQAYYSLVGRDVERDLVPMVQDAGLGLMVWSPLAGGFLTGKVTRDSIDATSRRTHPGMDFPPIDQDSAHVVLDTVKGVAARHEASIAQVSLAWLLAQPAVTSVTIGTRKPEQLADNLAAGDLTLTAEDLAELDDVSRLPVPYPNWLQSAFAPARLPQ